ncbi:hypothetical protein [Paratractidigestivibacter sp.]|uniref:hypothetical protein n=1 Tax=Paratractidigestivibacter sp. TaxID=2847316 RepID=UPI002ABDD1E1|nr:hypothetical protein [Paratractidigestivibacter sp.]
MINMSRTDEFAAAQGVGDALRGLLDTPQAKRAMGPGRLAQQAWYRVNGDIERAHTRGTYLTRGRRSGDAPTFVVYTDTRTCAIDFRANREVYLARMAAAGFEFSDIEFRQDRRPAQKEAAGRARSAKKPAAPRLPELTAEEEARIRAAVEDQPENLRERAYKAMCASVRRQKYDSAQNS